MMMIINVIVQRKKKYDARLHTNAGRKKNLKICTNKEKKIIICVIKKTPLQRK